MAVPRPRPAEAPPGVRPLAVTPRTGEPLEVAAGVFLLRLPLPFALDHINVYLLEDGPGWTVVDCGLDTPAARQAWEAVLAGPVVGGRPLRRVIVTHHHPDHIGLAGWLCGREPTAPLPLEISPGELPVSHRYADPGRDPHGERVGFWTANGMPAGTAARLAGRMPNYLRAVHPLPEATRPLGDAPIEVGGRRWRPVIGRGHAPEHVALFCPEDDLLISGDHVLPVISPNIGVWPDGPQDPLGDYLDSLPTFAGLGRDPLVLPAHHGPFRGLAARVGELAGHHRARLDALEAALGRQPQSCFDCLPALFDRPLKREQLGFAMAEGLAHLHRLARAGRLVVEVDGGIRRFRPAPPGTVDAKEPRP